MAICCPRAYMIDQGTLSSLFILQLPRYRGCHNFEGVKFLKATTGKGKGPVVALWIEKDWYPIGVWAQCSYWELV